MYLKHFRHTFLLGLCALLVLALAPAPVFSASPKVDFNFDPGTDPDSSAEGEETMEELRTLRERSMEFAIERLRSTQYFKATYENLSKLYWGLDVFDLEDDDAVSFYLLINECPLYREFADDDFEWHRILGITRDYIKQSKNSFPRHFEFSQPVELGTYDFKNEGFEILTKSITASRTRFIIQDTSRIYGACLDRSIKRTRDSLDELRIKYPGNLFMTFSRPFFISHLHIDPESARDLLTRIQIRKEEGIFMEYDRTVYLRIRIRVIKLIEIKMQPHDPSGSFVSVFASVEGYEFYEDPDLTQMIYASIF